MNSTNTFVNQMLAVAAGFILAGCGRHPDAPAATTAPPRQAPVRLAQVEPRGRVAVEEVVGTVRSKTRSVIAANVSARILNLAVALGDRIQTGQVLVELDARELQARLDQAVAQRDQAELELKRFTTLLQQQSVTQQEFDNVQSRQRIAAAAAAGAQTMLGYAKITAPFNGVVTRRLAEVGNLATPGQPLLEIEDPANLRLEADIPEALEGSLKLGARLAVRISSISADLEGVVSEIAPAADPASRTFPTKLDLPTNPALRAGQFGRVAVPIGEKQSLRVPAAAVARRGQLELVFVAANSARSATVRKGSTERSFSVTNLTAQLRLVKTGKNVGQEVEILSGLDAGEWVVVEGGAQLQDGQPIEAKP